MRMTALSAHCASRCQPNLAQAFIHGSLNLHSLGPSLASSLFIDKATNYATKDLKRYSFIPRSFGKDVYQPFRPPLVNGSDVMSVEEQLEILKERRGYWHDYAQNIVTLQRAGFTPSAIDEATGLTGVEQNHIVVASQVRSSMASGGFDKEALAYFDIGGAEILYELRILSGEQRKNAAEFVIERKMDGKYARELARAIKEYERRKNEEGRDCFTSSPGDCMAFACYRQAKEHRNIDEKESMLRKGIEFAVTSKAVSKLSKALGMEDDDEGTKTEESASELFIMRLALGETKGLVMIPIAEPTKESLENAPSSVACGDGPFRICNSKLPWNAWVPLPKWDQVMEAIAPVAIPYPDSSLLPPDKRKMQEQILVVVDKGNLTVEDTRFYLVPAKEGNGLSIQTGLAVLENTVQPLARVLIILRPPLVAQQNSDQDPEDWV